MVSSRRQGSAQRWTEKHRKGWLKLAYLNIKMNLLAEVGDTACSWCCSLSWNWVSGVLGAGFKAWPSAKPGVGNTRFSQVSPVHFPVLVFLSKGPVLLNTNFNLNMNFKGFFCKTFSQLHLGTASGESAQHEPSSPRGVQAVHCDLVPRGGLPGDLRPPPLSLLHPLTFASCQCPHSPDTQVSHPRLVTELPVHFLIRLGPWHVNRV